VSSLQVNVEQDGQVKFITLIGVINEDSTVAKIDPGQCSAVVINTAQVSRINSVGVRDWVNWIEPLSERVPVYLTECSPAVVFHANFVTNFLGRARVVSLYAPYYCTSCDHEASLLVDAQEVMKSATFTTPECSCEVCGGKMAFDDLDESYFGFLEALRDRELDEQVLASLAKRSRPVGEMRAKTPLAQPHETTSLTMSSTPGNTFDPGSLSSGQWRSMGSDTGSSLKLEPRPTETKKRGGFRIEYVLVGLLLATVALVAVALFR
jgi:hypothetical protein